VTALNVSSIVKRLDGFVEAEVDGEIVALNIDRGTCYGLNKVGSRIWALLVEQKRIGDLCATLVSEYEVEPRTCEQQVLELLEQFLQEGIIERRQSQVSGDA
jgi:hypothetical protein